MVGLDITNNRYGYLTALELVERENKHIPKSRRRWKCRCDCGNIAIIEQRLLTTQRNGIKSCGCIRNKAHLLATSKCEWLTMEYLWSFDDWEKPSIEHIIPKSKGGTNELANLQFLTVFENLCKRDLSMDEWVDFKKTNNITGDIFLKEVVL